MDTPYLAPIEQPHSLVMKAVYYAADKWMGTVPTPIKVYGPRLPAAFGRFAGMISRLDRKLVLPKETVALIREQVSRLNECTFCQDIGRWFAMKDSMDLAKFDALGEYETSPLFTAAEQAALAYATELTTTHRVKPETFNWLHRHYGEREICEIAFVVATEHVYNLTNIGLNIHSDKLCDLRRRRAAGATVGSA